MNITFEPRLKEPGQLILAEDWNNIQKEIKTDLMALKAEIDEFGEKKLRLHIASGIATHGQYITLKWNVTPHVILTPNDTGRAKNPIIRYRCYADRVSPNGFYVRCYSEGEETGGIVNWFAIATY